MRMARSRVSQYLQVSHNTDVLQFGALFKSPIYIMKTVFKILAFLSLLDETGTALSITNIGLCVMIAKMAIAASVDWPSVVVVITAFANYAHKRVINTGAASVTTGPVNIKPSDNKA
jgi:hypothetical protein